jgi:hypothetical protein
MIAMTCAWFTAPRGAPADEAKRARLLEAAQHHAEPLADVSPIRRLIDQGCDLRRREHPNQVSREEVSPALERVIGHGDEVDRVALIACPFGIEISKRLGRHRLLLSHALADDGRHAVACRRQHVPELGHLRLAGHRAAAA